MAVLTRWQILWSGGGISGRAATTLHYLFTASEVTPAMVTEHGQALTNGISNTLRKIIPPAVQLQVSNEVFVLDTPSGQILNVLGPTDPNGPFGGQGDGPYSIASGGVVSLNTAAILKGRRVKGRVFAVPLAGNAYDTDGTLSPAGYSTLTQFGQNIAPTGADKFLVVYTRPATGAMTGGNAAPVTSTSVRDRVAVLRSRRD